MDQISLGLTIAKGLLLFIKHGVEEAEKAKTNDGRITPNELPKILLDAGLRSLDDLGAGDLNGLLGKIK